MSTIAQKTDAVGDYVDAVRAELADLPADAVAELTEGLAADLTETMAVQQDQPTTAVDMFGLPATYAAELRSAAGLGRRPRIRLPRGRSWTFARGLSRAFDVIREDVRYQFGAALADRRWWPGLRDFLRAVRPSWWAFRAFLAYWYISQLGAQSIHEPLGKDLGLPHSPLTWLAMLGLLVLSVELGRRRLPALAGAALVVFNVWLVAVVLLVLPVSVYWAW
ncbi:hypothetical protein Kisp01_48750 [Kineosporia sp. NBRC 101677]|uniref:hypothetical protein n=1 Tax=Kineosporia sp. NBRC 101677 TaxID=3032197 RepID=UPI0024A0FE86|nr:hypothetical protein [Kineosporia sp. NBRC 101677]GLY17861.1 hypothetical protein Kisp01_48750 [Kineosporia sp. NBRC 101677]